MCGIATTLSNTENKKSKQFKEMLCSSCAKADLTPHHTITVIKTTSQHIQTNTTFNGHSPRKSRIAGFSVDCHATNSVKALKDDTVRTITKHQLATYTASKFILLGEMHKAYARRLQILNQINNLLQNIIIIIIIIII